MRRGQKANLTISDDHASIVLKPFAPTSGDGVICKSWDLGAPDVRITTVDRSGSDGTDESGGFLGARTVTLDLAIFGDFPETVGGHDAYWYAEQLAAFCHPLRKPVLSIQRDSELSAGKTWSLALRGTPFSISYGPRAAALLEMQLSFVAPLGLLQSDLNSLSTIEASMVAATDWHFWAAFPKGFGFTSGGPHVVATVAGSAPAYPVIYINGPCINPEIRDELGNRFAFSGLTLLSGQTVQIDMEAGSVLLASPDTGVVNPDADLYHTVNFNVSSFWRWLPGAHTVSYVAKAGSMVVQWRDRAFTI